MVLCFRPKEKEPADEYDPIPWYLGLRMKWGKQETMPRTGETAIRYGSNRLVKSHCLCTEYQALKLIDRHTSVPTYKVLNVFNRPGGKLVEYEALSGKPLDRMWPKMQAHQRAKAVSDLGRYVEQLRKIPQPKHCVVGDATLGGANDSRFGHSKVGPFYTITAFQEFERRGRPPEDFPEKEVQATHLPARPYELRFTHANLCPENVLVDDSGRITAIIGWESAGWYPEYWEYTQMCHNTPTAMSDWLDAMKGAMKRYDRELVCEEVLRVRYTPSTYDLPRSVRAPSPTPSELQRERQEIDNKNTESTSG